MNKQQFLDAVLAQTQNLPQTAVRRSLDFYEEMIDDRMEDGMTEEEAVAAMGSPKEIAAQIALDTPLLKLVTATVRPKRSLRPWEIVLLVLGAPLWFPLVLAAAIVLLAVYIVVWSAVIVFYAADLSLAAGAVAGVAGSVALFAMEQSLQAVLFLGAGLFCTGAAILAFFGCNQLARSILKFTRLLLRRLKGLFIGKGERV